MVESGNTSTLLVIDDSLHELRELSAILVKHFHVRFATDGRQGFERARALAPDLILLDVQMPSMDGFTACRLLKAEERTQSIPVLFLTAHSKPEQRMLGFKLGAADFITKPFYAEEVLARVQIHLRFSRYRGERKGEGAPDQAQQDPWADVRDAHVRVAVRHIRDHIDSALPLQELTELTGVSAKRLTALFRTHLGMTISSFISEQRMKVSQRLLSETSMAVQDIALEVGFGNPANFATAFRQRTGLTPRAYRDAVGQSDRGLPR